MAIRYLGNKSTLYINALDGSGELAGVCNKTLEYERTRELIETTTLQGEEVGHVLGLKRGSASFNNLSLFMEPGDEGYYDELCRGWFESGALLFCSLRDEVDSNVRVINFYAYIEQYRIVRNNNEAASFDLQLRQTTPNLGDVCPVVVFDSYIDPVQNQIYNTDYTFTGNPLIGSYTIRLLLGSTLIYEDTVTNTGVITGTWEDLLPDTLFIVEILPDGEDEGCTYSFFSFGVPCPVLGLDVGTTSVDVSSNPDPQITRVIYQISTSTDPDDIFDSAVTTTPFAASFTGLSEDTTYYIRAIIQIFDNPEVRYTRTCGWVEFTTGQPYVPPTSYPITGYFSIDDLDICGDPLGNEAIYYSDTDGVADGTLLYFDEDLANPVNGFNYFVISSNGQQWALNDNLVIATTGDTCPI
jgi:hypothetical protein